MANKDWGYKCTVTFNEIEQDYSCVIKFNNTEYKKLNEGLAIISQFVNEFQTDVVLPSVSTNIETCDE